MGYTSVIMSSGATFDPTAPDPCAAAPLSGTSDLVLFQRSPIFLNHAYTINGVNVGTTQYVDAFQQASFWSLVGGKAYHTLLSVTTLSPITVHVPFDSGFTFPSGGCGNLGMMEYNWFDTLVTGTLLPALAAHGVNP